MPNAVALEVLIDGVLFLGGFDFPEADKDIEVLVKLKHEESKTTLTSSTEDDDSAAIDNHDNREKEKVFISEDNVRSTESILGSSRRSDIKSAGTPLFDFKRLEDLDGTFVPLGAKTLVSRGVQTEKKGERGPFKIPARFEGNMLVPMYFEGLMLTPDFFYQLIDKAAEKRGKPTIPVLFKSGMLATAFRERVKNLDMSTDFSKQVERVRVKFEGRLRDIVEPSWCKHGIPVILDGKLVF